MGVFLIEVTGSPVIAKKHNRILRFYQLQMDKELIYYMKKFKNQIQYVVFCNGGNCEILSLKNSSKLNFDEDICFDVGRFKNQNILLDIAIDGSKL